MGEDSGKSHTLPVRSLTGRGAPVARVAGQIPPTAAESRRGENSRLSATPELALLSRRDRSNLCALYRASARSPSKSYWIVAFILEPRRVRMGPGNGALDVVRGRVRRQPQMPKRLSAVGRHQCSWRSVTLECVGTFFVLIGLAIGLLTLRFALVLVHGLLH
jgi:hypothetical protein